MKLTNSHSSTNVNTLNRLFIPLLFILCCWLSACSDKEDKLPGQVNENYFEGPIRLETLPSKLMIPGNYLCYFVNRDTDKEIELKAEVEADGQHVTLIPTDPVPVGNYIFARATALDQPVIDQQEGCAEVALGCCFMLTKDNILEASNNYDYELGCFGSGTDEDPFLITSYIQMMSLSELMADLDPDFDPDVRYDLASYRLEADIDLSMASHTYLNVGWIPIGSQMTVPFQGHFDGSGTDGKGYHVIKNMGAFSEGTQITSPIGLFGYLKGAYIHNIEIANSMIRVQRDDPRVIPCGFLAGAVVTAPAGQNTTTLRNCRVDNNCRIKGEILSGGLIGVVDQYANLLVDSCENQATIENRLHHAGGLVGGAIFGSVVYLRNSVNRGTVNNQGNATGGLIGSADTVVVQQCTNFATIKTTGEGVGTGGLVGCTFNGGIMSSRNQGAVHGRLDAGGLVGSTAKERATGRDGENTYGNLFVQCSANFADVEGLERIGGIVGGAQLNAYDSYNFGNIHASRDMAAGFVGFSPVSAIFNCNNDGSVSCDGSDTSSAAGGIVAYGTDFLVLGCNNYGAIEMKQGCVGGIYGYSERLGFVHYSGNMAPITCGDGSVGGIAGRAGKRKNFTTQNVINIFKTAVSCLGSFIDLGKNDSKPKFLDKLNDGIEVYKSVITGLTSAHSFIDGFKIHASQLTPSYFDAIQSTTLADFTQKHETMIRVPHIDVIPFVTYGMYEKQLDLQQNMYEAASAQSSNVIANANAWRGDIEDDMAAREKAHEIGMNALRGFIMCFDLASIFAKPMGPIASQIINVASSVLNIIQESVDYSYNRVVLSQVYNYGKVTLTKSGGYCGGITGELNDYARMADSYSVGNLSASSSKDVALLASRLGHYPRMGRNYGAAGSSYQLFGNASFADYSKNYGYDPDNTQSLSQPSNRFYINKKQLQTQNTYGGFDFNLRWIFPAENNLPIVNRSMLENYRKEYY